MDYWVRGGGGRGKEYVEYVAPLSSYWGKGAGGPAPPPPLPTPVLQKSYPIYKISTSSNMQMQLEISFVPAYLLIGSHTLIHSVYSIFEKTAGYVKNRCTCLFAGKLFPLFFLLFTYVLWQKGGCSFSVKSYTYLHAIV